jgi:hypothetical protein
VPPPPEGYTIVGYANGTVAYVPTSKTPPEVKKPPLGYVAVTHPTAGKIFVPSAYAPGGTFVPTFVFGATAIGYAAPVVSLAPPPMQVYSFPGRNVSAYPPPTGYTPVLYGGAAVGYVGTTKGLSPSYVPPGYTTLADPNLGNIVIPSNYAPGGARTAGYFFSAVAAGQPAAFVVVNGK